MPRPCSLHYMRYKYLVILVRHLMLMNLAEVWLSTCLWCLLFCLPIPLEGALMFTFVALLNCSLILLFLLSTNFIFFQLYTCKQLFNGKTCVLLCLLNFACLWFVVLQDSDVNEDGYIDRQEFVDFILSLTSDTFVSVGQRLVLTLVVAPTIAVVTKKSTEGVPGVGKFVQKLPVSAYAFLVTLAAVTFQNSQQHFLKW